MSGPDDRFVALQAHGWRERARFNDEIEFLHAGRPRERIVINVSAGARGWMHFELNDDGVDMLVGHSRYGTTLTAHLAAPPAAEA